MQVNKGDCVIVLEPGRRKRKAVVVHPSKATGYSAITREDGTLVYYKRKPSMITVMYTDKTYGAIKPEWIIEKLEEVVEE